MPIMPRSHSTVPRSPSNSSLASRVILVCRSGSAWLGRRPWPGNIRQLQQVMERSVLIGGTTTLTAADFENQEQLGLSDDRGRVLPRPGAMTLEEMERAMIANCMRHYEGNISRAAEALGLSRAALYRRLEKHGLAQGE